MQITPLDKKTVAEWRAKLRPTDASHISAAAILFTASALALALCRIEAVAGLYLVYAAVFYYMLTHSFASLVIVGIPGVALFGVSAMAPGLPHPFLMPTVYAALVLGGLGGSFLLVHCREKKFLPLLALPVAAYALAGAVVGPYLGLLVLIPAAISLVLAYGMLNCRPQTPVLMLLAAVLAGCAFVTFLVWYALQGWPAANPIAYLGQLVRDTMGSVWSTALEAYAAEGIEVSVSDTGISNLSVMVANILPGMFLAGCGVLAFVIYRNHLRVLLAWGTLTSVPLRVGALTISPLAAGLFLLSYLASAVAGGGLFGTICENLSLVLQPALVLVGVTSLLGRDPRRRSRLSFFLLIALALLLLNYPTLALSLAAVLGAVRILLAGVFGRREKKDGNE